MTDINDQKEKRKLAIGLLKDYTKAFNLMGVTDPKLLKKWETIHGPMLVAAFNKTEGDEPREAPIAWVDRNNVLWIEHDEDLLTATEPAVQEATESLVRIAIDQKKPIHPVQ